MCLLTIFLFYTSVTLAADLSSFDEQCTSDAECDPPLFCDKISRTCKCPRGFIWETLSKVCLHTEKEIYDGKIYHLLKDMIIPAVVLVLSVAFGSLCFQFFRTHKNCQRRRRGADMARALEEAQLPHANTTQPTTWIASYRVFGTVEQSGPPCILVPIGPPTYEEALKHKVLLSSKIPLAPSSNPTLNEICETAYL